MNIEQFRHHCITKPGTTESFPFDSSGLVFKVLGKMFAICNVDHYTGFAAKCDPQWAAELREKYPHGILPGYHFNKRHWNTVKIDEDIPPQLIRELIDHSYELVVKKLPKKLRSELDDFD
jgi:predicted DNA-binding protein (MmcQ/YjbR family)